jgi:thioredoxin 1
MEPILEEIALEYAVHGVTVVKVNSDVAQRSAEHYRIRSIPTLIFFRDGEPLFEMVGPVPKPVLEREIGLLL